MFKKTSDDVKKYIKLSIKFSAIFREHLIQNHTKIMENGFVHKHRQRIHVWSAFLLANKQFFVDFWIPGELSGRPGSLAEASHFFIKFRLPLEIGPDRSLGGPREAQGVPQAPPEQHFESILDRFSGWISTLAISEIY